MPPGRAPAAPARGGSAWSSHCPRRDLAGARARRPRRGARRSRPAGAPAPPGLSRASCQGSGVVPPHWARPAPATRTGHGRLGLANRTTGRARRPARSRRPGRARAPASRTERPAPAPGRRPARAGPGRTRRAPPWPAPWRTHSSRSSGGWRAATGRTRSAAARTRATSAPSRPWATDAEATPVVAHANAARPRTQRVVTTGPEGDVGADGRERHPEDDDAARRPGRRRTPGSGSSGRWSTSQVGSASSGAHGPTGSGPPRPAPVQPSVQACQSTVASARLPISSPPDSPDPAPVMTRPRASDRRRPRRRLRRRWPARRGGAPP